MSQKNQAEQVVMLFSLILVHFKEPTHDQRHHLDICTKNGIISQTGSNSQLVNFKEHNTS